MGGGLVIRILTEGEEVVRKLEECILQPQSEIEKVRAFLLEKGYEFLEEDMVCEDGKYYPMMKVRPPVADTARRRYRSKVLGYGSVKIWKAFAGETTSGTQRVSGKRDTHLSKYFRRIESERF